MRRNNNFSKKAWTRRAPAPTREQSRLATYHQAVNFFFANLKPDTPKAEIDAALQKIMQEHGI